LWPSSAHLADIDRTRVCSLWCGCITKIDRGISQRFPNALAECSAVEDSEFFQRKFDGVVAWGLLFLLPPGIQSVVIHSCQSLESGRQNFYLPHLKELLKFATDDGSPLGFLLSDGETGRKGGGLSLDMRYVTRYGGK
jgi:hypothetical protein